MEKTEMDVQAKKELVKSRIEASIEVKKKLDVADFIRASEILVRALKAGKKVLFCGNGGSAADAQHFAAELVVRFKRDRQALPALALSSDPSIVTAASNDYGYENVFARQVEAYGGKGDVLVAISTSGKSPNVNNAVRVALDRNMEVIYMTGERELEPDLEHGCSLVIHVPSTDTPRIQEAHELIGHTMLELVEMEFIEKAPGEDRKLDT
jgi:D-sedoheptulose 7-phosphate isomerase